MISGYIRKLEDGYDVNLNYGATENPDEYEEWKEIEKTAEDMEVGDILRIWPARNGLYWHKWKVEKPTPKQRCMECKKVFEKWELVWTKDSEGIWYKKVCPACEPKVYKELEEIEEMERIEREEG